MLTFSEAAVATKELDLQQVSVFSRGTQSQAAQAGTPTLLSVAAALHARLGGAAPWCPMAPALSLKSHPRVLCQAPSLGAGLCVGCSGYRASQGFLPAAGVGVSGCWPGDPLFTPSSTGVGRSPARSSEACSSQLSESGIPGSVLECPWASWSRWQFQGGVRPSQGRCDIEVSGFFFFFPENEKKEPPGT